MDNTNKPTTVLGEILGFISSIFSHSRRIEVNDLSQCKFRPKDIAK